VESRVTNGMSSLVHLVRLTVNVFSNKLGYGLDIYGLTNLRVISLSTCNCHMLGRRFTGLA